MIRLGVNIDHVGTIRQARQERFPEVIAAAHAAVLGGADQITVHLREDRRHIQDYDVEGIRKAVVTPLNFEMACTDEMVAFARRIKPCAVCLVPESREEITTEGGLDVTSNKSRVADTTAALVEAGIPVSLFVDPDEESMLASSEVGAQAIEIHTGRYANAKTEGAIVKEFVAIRDAARTARQLGLRVHAGHGIDYQNVWRLAGLPDVEEFNIGFAIVARAVFVGLRTATREMRDAIDRAQMLAQNDRTS